MFAGCSRQGALSWGSARPGSWYGRWRRPSRTSGGSRPSSQSPRTGRSRCRSSGGTGAGSSLPGASRMRPAPPRRSPPPATGASASPSTSRPRAGRSRTRRTASPSSPPCSGGRGYVRRPPSGHWPGAGSPSTTPTSVQAAWETKTKVMRPPVPGSAGWPRVGYPSTTRASLRFGWTMQGPAARRTPSSTARTASRSASAASGARRRKRSRPSLARASTRPGSRPKRSPGCSRSTSRRMNQPCTPSPMRSECLPGSSPPPPWKRRRRGSGTPRTSCSARSAATGWRRARPSRRRGPAGELVVEKTKSVRGTCAIARAPAPLDASSIGSPRGELAVVGIGPGDAGTLTPEARAAIEGAGHLVGYRRYLDLVAGLVRGQAVHPYELGEERARAEKAIHLAATGERVALVCSGDPGIYAMAIARHGGPRRIATPGRASHRGSGHPRGVRPPGRRRPRRRARRPRLLRGIALRPPHSTRGHRGTARRRRPRRLRDRALQPGVGDPARDLRPRPSHPPRAPHGGDPGRRRPQPRAEVASGSKSFPSATSTRSASTC